MTIVMPSSASFFDDLQHFAYHFGIESGGRFVEQHYFGIHRKRADYRDTLFLSARQGSGVYVRLFAESDLVEKFVCLFARVFYYLELVRQGEKFCFRVFVAFSRRGFESAFSKSNAEKYSERPSRRIRPTGEERRY